MDVIFPNMVIDGQFAKCLCSNVETVFFYGD